MDPSLPADEPADPRVLWATLIDDLSDAIYAFGEHLRWSPIPNSPFYDDHVTHGISAPYAHGVSLVVATRDRLAGLAALFRARPPVIWAAYPVARACLDTAARGAWMLDTAASPAERNSRAFELLRIAIYANRSGSASFQRFTRQHEQVLRDRLVRNEVDFISNDHGMITAIAGARAPGLHHLVKDLLGDDTFASDVYSWLSGISHGGLDVLREHLASEPIDDSKATITFSASAQDIAVASYAACVGTLTVVDRFAFLCGWGHEWHELRDVHGADASALLHKFLRDVPASPRSTTPSAHVADARSRSIPPQT